MLYHIQHKVYTSVLLRQIKVQTTANPSTYTQNPNNVSPHTLSNLKKKYHRLLLYDLKLLVLYSNLS